jgi:hypothetical protein
LLILQGIKVSKTTKNKRFLPKCLNPGRQLAFASTGHMTPCCWTNVSWSQPYLKEIFAEKMHIDNFNTIDEILTSEPWVKFFDMLKNNPKDAPPICKHFCTTTDLDHNIEGDEEIIRNDN